MRDFQKMLDRIAYDIQRAADRVENVCQRHWAPRREWKQAGTGPDIEWARAGLRRVPRRLSDLATDGSCAMRYLLGYSLKGLAALQIFGGVLTVAIIFAVEDNPWHNEGFSVGLVLVATAQLIWWAGRLVHRSADRKRYAQLQHRLLRLARKKGGSLTVLEAATDCRMTVEKAEEILRELAVRGHAEVRVSDSGLMVYKFPEIERSHEKDWARPVDEL